MIFAILVTIVLGVLMAIVGTFLYFMFDGQKAKIGTAFQLAGVITIVISIITSISFASLLL